MTYTEVNNRDKFDWREFLQRERYTTVELKTAGKLANSWVTCACGNLCEALPRWPGGTPEDQQLARLGNEFAAAVEGLARFHDLGGPTIGAQRLARDVLDKIEARSAELLQAQAPQVSLREAYETILGGVAAISPAIYERAVARMAALVGRVNSEALRAEIAEIGKTMASGLD